MQLYTVWSWPYNTLNDTTFELGAKVSRAGPSRSRMLRSCYAFVVVALLSAHRERRTVQFVARIVTFVSFRRLLTIGTQTSPFTSTQTRCSA